MLLEEGLESFAVLLRAIVLAADNGHVSVLQVDLVEDV